MPTDLTSGVDLISKDTPRRYIWAEVNRVVSALFLRVNNTFADANERDLRLPSPTRGQEAFLDSAPVGLQKIIHSGTAWGPVPNGIETDRIYYATGQATGNPGVTDLATKIITPRTYPLLVIVNASIKVTGLVGAAALWINQSGATADTITAASAEIPGDSIAVNCTAFLSVPANTQLTVHASVNQIGPSPTVTGSLAYYNDHSHSFLQTVSVPLIPRI